MAKKEAATQAAPAAQAAQNSASGDDGKFIFGKLWNTMPGRLLFPVLTTPKAFEGNSGAPKWSAGLVVKPAPRITEIIDNINEVGIKAFGKKWTDKPDLFMKPYMTGEDLLDKLREKGKKISEKSIALYTGHIWLTANANTENRKGQPLEPPNCYLADGSKLPRRAGNSDDLKAIESQFYPGSWCMMAVTPLSYEKGRSLGVKLILKGIRFLKDGERLGGENIDAMMQEDMGADFDFEDEVSAAFSADADASVNI